MKMYANSQFIYKDSTINGIIKRSNISALLFLTITSLYPLVTIPNGKTGLSPYAQQVIKYIMYT